MNKLRMESRTKAKVSARMRAHERTSTRTQSLLDQPDIKLTKSIKFMDADEAGSLLRKTFQRQKTTHHLEMPLEFQRQNAVHGAVSFEEDIAEAVRERYLACCNRWNSKPNSQVMSCLRNTEAVPGEDGDGLEISYDFGGAHLGDRGVTCLLHALALDKRLVSLSLRSCGLRGGSAPVIAIFIEMHAKLRSIDLSFNSLSFEAGEVLLGALERRSKGRRNKKHLWNYQAGAPMSRPGTPPKQLDDLMVDLTGTWFGWDQSEGQTVGPPCGNLWAGTNDTRAKLAPSSYEALRNSLDKTQRVRYKVPQVEYSFKMPFLDVSSCGPAVDNQKLRRATARPPTLGF